VSADDGRPRRRGHWWWPLSAGAQAEASAQSATRSTPAAAASDPTRRPPPSAVRADVHRCARYEGVALPALHPGRASAPRSRRPARRGVDRRPEGWDVAGWYQEGHVPAERQAQRVNRPIDSRSGNVFVDLPRLRIGAAIRVDRQDSTSVTSGSPRRQVGTLPAQEVYAPTRTLAVADHLRGVLTPRPAITGTTSWSPRFRLTPMAEASSSPCGPEPAPGPPAMARPRASSRYRPSGRYSDGGSLVSPCRTSAGPAVTALGGQEPTASRRCCPTGRRRTRSVPGGGRPLRGGACRGRDSWYGCPRVAGPR
jgi:hypothetical protein